MKRGTMGVLATAVGLAALAGGCATEDMPPALDKLTGTVTYRQRIALPDDAVVQVRLLDVSRADAPSLVLSEANIETKGWQVPVPFVVHYDPAMIDPRLSYAVDAKILVNGQIRWLNTARVRVLTFGAPKDAVEIVVTPAK
ncbi:MAG: YbaY family lipoprotein [Phycisphaerales bacterium]